MDTHAPGFFQADPALALFYDFDFFFHGSHLIPFRAGGQKAMTGMVTAEFQECRFYLSVSLPLQETLHKTNLFLNCNVLDSNQYTIPAFIVSAVILFFFFET